MTVVDLTGKDSQAYLAAVAGPMMLRVLSTAGRRFNNPMLQRARWRDDLIVYRGSTVSFGG